MDAVSLKAAMARVSDVITNNRDYLILLDQQNGDGDLGISMSDGFRAVTGYLDTAEEIDLGRLFAQMAGVFNEKAPSSLGTILSFGMMAMARRFKGQDTASLNEVADALQAGITNIMEKAGSKPGEKTVLDSLCPAVAALQEKCPEGATSAFRAAAEAAAHGSESTRNMISKHGRAAYYGEKSIGVLDGGSVVGKLIFEAVSEHIDSISQPCSSG